MNKALTDALSSINAYYGAGTVTTGAELPPMGFLPTRISALNDLLGGGLPKGQIVEIYGNEGIYEYTLALELARAAENPLYVTPGELPSPYELKGWRGLSVACPETLEDALSIIETAAGAFDLIILASYPAFPTKVDSFNKLDEMNESGAGQVLSYHLGRIKLRLAASGCVLVIVNQLRTCTRILFGDKDITPGGRALKSFEAVKLRADCLEQMRAGGELVGHKVRVWTMKNKYAPPFRTVDLEYSYVTGYLGDPLLGRPIRGRKCRK